MPNWDDPRDPAWESLARNGMTSDSLMKLGDETFGAHDGLTIDRRIDRGMTAMREKGYILAGPDASFVRDEASVLVYTFVRDEQRRDPVTRWGARLVLIVLIGCGLLTALLVARALYHAGA